MFIIRFNQWPFIIDIKIAFVYRMCGRFLHSFAYVIHYIKCIFINVSVHIVSHIQCFFARICYRCSRAVFFFSPNSLLSFFSFTWLFMLAVITCRWTFYLHIRVIFIINVRNGYSDTIDYNSLRCLLLLSSLLLSSSSPPLSSSHMIHTWLSVWDSVGICVSKPHIHIQTMLRTAQNVRFMFRLYVHQWWAFLWTQSAVFERCCLSAKKYLYATKTFAVLYIKSILQRQEKKPNKFIADSDVEATKWVHWTIKIFTKPRKISPFTSSWFFVCVFAVRVYAHFILRFWVIWGTKKYFFVSFTQLFDRFCIWIFHRLSTDGKKLY